MTFLTVQFNRSKFDRTSDGSMNLSSKEGKKKSPVVCLFACLFVSRLSDVEFSSVRKTSHVCSTNETTKRVDRNPKIQGQPQSDRPIRVLNSIMKSLKAFNIEQIFLSINNRCLFIGRSHDCHRSGIPEEAIKKTGDKKILPKR